MTDSVVAENEADRCWVGDDDALGELDAVGVADRILAGEITATEAVDAAISRAERAEPTIAAFAETDFERARARACTAVEGRFAGLPMAIKDQTAVQGLTLGFGSQALSGRTPSTESSPITKIFESIGTTTLGTSTLPEFGLTSSSDFHHGSPTRNPWNLDHIAGGSSSGAAALVASGVLPMAHGGDGGGSIRIPAAACGLVGLKPSRRRFPHENDEAPMPVKISAYGVLSRSVRDQCVFAAEAEKQYPQHHLPPIGLVDRPNDRPLRIGILATSPINRSPSTSVTDAVDRTATLLESLGHQVDVADDVLTQGFADDFILYWAFLAGALAVGGKRIVDPSFDASRLTSFTRGLANHAKVNLHRVPGAVRGSVRFRAPMTPTWGQLTSSCRRRSRTRRRPSSTWDATSPMRITSIDWRGGRPTRRFKTRSGPPLSRCHWAMIQIWVSPWEFTSRPGWARSVCFSSWLCRSNKHSHSDRSPIERHR